MNWLLALGLSASITGWAKTDYKCWTEFGETVPIRKTVLKKNAPCKPCESPSAKIAPWLIDQNASKKWNLNIEKDPKLTSTIKRRTFIYDQRLIFLDTRYAKRSGPEFKFRLNCEEKIKDPRQKCAGQFVDSPDASFLKLETPVFDSRIDNNKGSVEITIGSREHLGFITRVFKKAVPLTESETIPSSSSGELKFMREDPEFIQDVGTDEQLLLMGDLRTRIAAFEIKIRCHALNLLQPSSLE